jgi:hypothetical protein
MLDTMLDSYGGSKTLTSERNAGGAKATAARIAKIAKLAAKDPEAFSPAMGVGGGAAATPVTATLTAPVLSPDAPEFGATMAAAFD